MNEIDKLIESTEEIKSLPTSAIKLMQMTESETSSGEDLAKVIGMDQGLTAKVIRLVNSPFYGLTTKVASVKHAVALLGFQCIRNIALSTELSKSMNKAFDGYLMNKGELWRHGVAVASIASRIAKKKDRTLVDTAFTAGMVHDLGRILLSRFLLSSFNKVKDLVRTENIAFNEAEKRVFGMDHAEAGGKLAKKWGFPADLVDAIKCHHEPGKSLHGKTLAAIIHVADIIAINCGIGVGGDGLSYELEESALAALHINETELDQYILDLQAGMKDIEDFVAHSSV
jgi:putative nucleotidyltransferase with HDIG domain